MICSLGILSSQNGGSHLPRLSIANLGGTKTLIEGLEVLSANLAVIDGVENAFLELLNNRKVFKALSQRKPCNKNKVLTHSEEFLMQTNHDLKVPVERIADEDIASAIRYLDPDYRSSKKSGDGAGVFIGIYVSLIVLLAGELAYLYLYVARS